MVTVSIAGRTETNMKESGKPVSGMVMDQTFSLMEISTLANIDMEILTALVSTSGLTATLMLENSKMG